MFYIKTFLIVLLLPVFIYSQNEHDSTEISFDEILNERVVNNSYVKSASKYSQSISESPISLSIITSDEIETYGYKNLSEVLNSVEGVYITNDLNYQFLGISGFGRPTDNNNRVQLLFDGHKLNDYVYNAAPIDEFSQNVAGFERIEVIKGPGSVLYGGNAMFGILNIIPKKNMNSLIPKFNASYGSFNSKSISGYWGYEDEKGFKINIHANYEKTDGRDFYFAEFDTPDNNNGKVEKLDGEKQNGLYASIKYNNFELFGLTSYRYKDVPTAPYGVDFGSQVFTEDSYKFLEAKYTGRLDYDKLFTCRLFYDNYKYYGLYIYDSMPYWDQDDSKSMGTEMSFLWDIIPNDRIILGVEFNKSFKADYKYWNDDEVFLEFNSPINIYSIYFQNEYQFSSKFTFYLAARYDNYENIHNEISPRVTLVYSPDKNNIVKLLSGSGFRIPGAYERALDYNAILNNNKSLSPEKILTFELNWEHIFSDRINLNLNIRRNRITSFIEQINNEEDETTYYLNQRDITSYGTGAILNFKINNFQGGYIKYSYQHAEDGIGNKIIKAPDNILKLGFYQEIFDYLKSSVEYNYESSKITVYQTSTKPVHYAVLNIFNPKPIYDFKFGFTIKNLFNKTIQSPGSLDNKQSFLNMPGRNYLLSISYDL